MPLKWYSSSILPYPYEYLSGNSHKRHGFSFLNLDVFESPPHIHRDAPADVPAPRVVVIITRGSVVISDILVVAATWYYISHTISIREQLIRGVWAGRPNLTTIMFRDGNYGSLEYSTHRRYSTISLLNVIDPVVYFININIFAGLSMINMISAVSSILVSHFLICIREAAEHPIQAFSSRSLSFVDSQGDSVTHRWLSRVEFAADIVNPSAGDSDTDAFFDFEDDVDSRSEDSAVEGSNDETELHEYATASPSVDAFMS
ncbi:predicted protein [Postia placenta Mad-698-R]|nr:predicted protein [Postia placenta Mad-698-R]